MKNCHINSSVEVETTQYVVVSNFFNNTIVLYDYKCI